MQCVVCSSSDDRHLWSCIGGCKRNFHAACAGVQRNCEQHLAKFMMPICVDCRKEFLDTSKIHKSLQDQIQSNHEIAGRLKAMDVINDTIDNLACEVADLKSALASVQKHSLTSCTEIKKHVSSLFDELDFENITVGVIAANNECNSNNMESAITTIENGFEMLHNEITEFRQLNKADDVTGAALMEEIRTLSDAVLQIPKQSTNAENQPTVDLQTEFTLAAKPNDGWRWLGNKKVWRSDWSKYDRKQLVRSFQTKAADKARRRRNRLNNRHDHYKYNYKRHWNQVNNFTNYDHTHNNVGTNNRNSHHQTLSKIRDIGYYAASKAAMNDKQLLAAAKVKFSGNRGSNYIAFHQGETMHPYRIEQREQQSSAEPIDLSISGRPTYSAASSSTSILRASSSAATCYDSGGVQTNAPLQLTERAGENFLY